MKYCISASYGNDSVALIQWAREQGLEDVTVIYSDTGWGSVEWPARVEQCEEWARSLGFKTHRVIANMQFEELMQHKKGFPSQRYQWCRALLKIIPFLTWLDDADPELQTTIVIGLRRSESQERANTPEFIEKSERHGGAKGIRQVIQWANSERGKYNSQQETLFNCDSGMCGQ
jgi:3'-phosphoadenosine 5'-phosphosulfate sulfotransferase (PAPS reductase)/FAD synthetase